MGWESEMPAGMILRKMYCAKCGSKLKKHKISETYEKGEKGFQNTILGQPQLFMKEFTKIYFVYKCPQCGRITTYDDQLQISKKQKQMKTKIITW